MFLINYVYLTGLVREVLLSGVEAIFEIWNHCLGRYGFLFNSASSVPSEGAR